VENVGNNEFIVGQLPNAVQFSTVNKIIPMDVNHDGNLDVILGGNMHGAEIETARHDASFGLVLLGDGKGSFIVQDNQKINLDLSGDLKDLKLIKISDTQFLIQANNNSSLRFVEISLP
jgi:hypothetical protein